MSKLVFFKKIQIRWNFFCNDKKLGSWWKCLSSRAWRSSCLYFSRSNSMNEMLLVKSSFILFLRTIVIFATYFHELVKTFSFTFKLKKWTKLYLKNDSISNEDTNKAMSYLKQQELCLSAVKLDCKESGAIMDYLTTCHIYCKQILVVF